MTLNGCRGDVLDREKIFVEYITSGVYKMLVLREKSDNGEIVYLKEYMKNLYVEINGACYWSNYLSTNRGFATITSIVAYLSENDVEYSQFRREIFKMLGLLNKISKELGGDSDE